MSPRVLLMLGILVSATAAIKPASAATSSRSWVEHWNDLEQEYAAGRLDDVELVRALTDLAWSRQAGPTCTTPLMRRAFEVSQRLSTAERAEVFPQALGSGRVDGSGSPLVVVDSVCATDVGDPQICVHTTVAGEEALAQTVFDLANEAWTEEIDTMGFATPHPDDNVELGPEIDIYLTAANGGAFTAPEASPDSDATSRADASAYIVIDDLIDPAEIGSFVAHELNHAIQFSYDIYEHDSAYEATSVLVEDRVFDGINDYTRFIATFQTAPYRALDWFPGFQSPELFYIYGSAAFLMFVSERYDGGDISLVRQMWENASQNGMTNEPDYYDALNTVLPVSLDEAYAEFAGWRVFVGDDWVEGFFSEGSSWANTPTIASHSLGQMPVVAGTTPNPPMEYGANYVAVDTSGGVEADRLVVSMDGDSSTDWSLVVVGVPISGSDTDPCFAQVAATGGSASLYVESLNLYRRVVVSVANLGSGDRDPDDEDYGASNYAYDIAYSANGEIDVTGLAGCPVDAADEPIGCECDVRSLRTTSPRSVLAGLLLLAMAGVFVGRARKGASRRSRR